MKDEGGGTKDERRLKMKSLLVTVLLISVVLSGCGTTMKTYTFQKERVDQHMEGNRGYLVGTPPPTPAAREVPKRTLIGVDIEIPILPGEEVELPPEEVVYEEEKVIEEEVEEEVAMPRAKPMPKAEPRKVEEEKEEEWIK